MPIQIVYDFSMLPMYFSSYASKHFQSDNSLLKVYTLKIHIENFCTAGIAGLIFA